MSEIKHCLQKDSINCGIYVCYFFKLIAEGKDLFFDSSKNSLIRKRLEMMNILKLSSSKNFCSKCGVDILCSDKIVKCDCFHKFHQYCYEYENISEKINCPICY